MDFNPQSPVLPEVVSKPPCATWSVWIGSEIEGTASRGVRTLFIRSLARFSSVSATDDWAFIRTQSKCSRVWFCKEFTQWSILRVIAKHFDEVCVEVEPQRLLCIPRNIRKMARLYLKVTLPEELKAGDHVCVGLPFADEAFEIGKGVKVNPSDYLKDVKIV